jgi:hypothetical protein
VLVVPDIIEDETFVVLARPQPDPPAQVEANALRQQAEQRQRQQKQVEQQQRLETERRRVEGVAKHREARRTVAVLNKGKEEEQKIAQQREEKQQQQQQREREHCCKQELVTARRAEALERHRATTRSIARLNCSCDGGSSSTARIDDPSSGVTPIPSGNAGINSAAVKTETIIVNRAASQQRQRWLDKRDAQAGRSLAHVVPHFTLAFTKQLM